LPEVGSRFNPNAIGGGGPGFAGIYALAAIPARYALERGAWGEAGRLGAPPSKFSYTQALAYLARGPRAPRTPDTVTVKASIDALQKIQQKLIDQKEAYWAEQADIQRREAVAWLAFAEKHTADALTEMRAAVKIEEGTEKSAVTPGPLAPAPELLG